MRQAADGQDKALAGHCGAAANRNFEGRWPRWESSVVAVTGGWARVVRATSAQGLYPGVTISLRGAPRAAETAERDKAAAHSGRVTDMVAARRAGNKAVFMVVSPGLTQALGGPGSSLRAGEPPRIPRRVERILPPGDSA